MNAGEGEIGEPLGRVDVESGSACSVLCTHLAHGEKQKNDADKVFHSRIL
jgi:hypothetical protein